MNKAKEEYRDAILEWQYCEISIDKLEKKLNKINEKYGTNYKIDSVKIK